MNKRNYGIELLRIVSMLMICALHIISRGGTADTSTINKLISNFMLFSCQCAVNCYAIISGYVGNKSRFKPSNIIKLWLQVELYSVGIAVIFALCKPEIGAAELIQAAFPIFNNRYWYFTAYFVTFCMMPFYNKFAEAIDKRRAKAFIVTVLMLFSVGSMGKGGEMFDLNRGFSCLWIGALYVVGACLNKLEIGDAIKKKGLLVYAVMIPTVYVVCMGGRQLLLRFGIDSAPLGYLESYTSPVTFVAAIALVLYFSQIKLNALTCKFTAWLAPMTFGVYLIHDNKILRQYLIVDRFVGFAKYSPPRYLLAWVAVILAVHLACSLIDYLRIWVFKLCRIDRVCKIVDDRIMKLYGENDK